MLSPSTLGDCTAVPCLDGVLTKAQGCAYCKVDEVGVGVSCPRGLLEKSHVTGIGDTCEVQFGVSSCLQIGGQELNSNYPPMGL